VVRDLWRRLASLQTPQQGGQVPRPRWWVFALSLGGLAAQCWARYHGWLAADLGFAGHLLLAWSTLAALLVAAHGRSFIGSWTGRTWAVLATATVCLLAFWHFGRMDAWARWWAPHIDPLGWCAPLLPFAYFALSGVVLRLVLPLAIGRRWGIGPADVGLGRGHSERSLVWTYAALYLAVLPFVLRAAGTAAFQAKYPMARAIIGSDRTLAWEWLVAYEALYVLVFVGGEFFWRGWLAMGLERDLGLYALLAMVIPYVIAHFGKPLPETLGAIAAGLALGWLALQHRSVWLGVAVHFAVAVTMDLAAIYRGGLRII
jgi:membrane protease YdiL (CAAX protease family)